MIGVLKGLMLGTLALLTACSDIRQPEQSNIGRDGYYFEAKPYQNKRVNVTVVYHESLEALRASYVKDFPLEAAATGSSNLLAYTEMYAKPKGKCVLHIVDPAVSYVPETAGHEFLHCVHGNWHPTQGQGQ